MAKVLQGKSAIVTGSSSGFGEAIAIRFAKEGCDVSLVGLGEKALNEVAAKCKSYGVKVAVTEGDLTKKETQDALMKKTLQTFGKLNILVNNAGILRTTPLLKPDHDTYDRIMEINLKTYYVMTTLCAPELVKTKGNIINISSMGSMKPEQKLSAYCMAKAAIDMLTKVTASELGEYQVRANSINPGSFPTSILQNAGMDDAAFKKFMEAGASNHALGRYGQIEELVNVVTFYASDAASFVTGSVVLVDGGCLVKGNKFDLDLVPTKK